MEKNEACEYAAQFLERLLDAKGGYQGQPERTGLIAAIKALRHASEDDEVRQEIEARERMGF